MVQHSSSIPNRDTEAEAIAMHARAGRLDLGDPDIRREATSAVRHTSRADVWGDSSSRRVVRWAITAGLAALVVWVVALVVPVLMTATS
ncbi:hypothetical protein [Microbacterium sp. NPDC076911]|uniref:hypothetical protein n=1 Tax=Microbacterium sp. NPDC076911 TaxID=3154958 RepID=UPI0034138A28